MSNSNPIPTSRTKLKARNTESYFLTFLIGGYQPCREEMLLQTESRANLHYLVEAIKELVGLFDLIDQNFHAAHATVKPGIVQPSGPKAIRDILIPDQNKDERIRIAWAENGGMEGMEIIHWQRPGAMIDEKRDCESHRWHNAGRLKLTICQCGIKLLTVALSISTGCRSCCSFIVIPSQ